MKFFKQIYILLACLSIIATSCKKTSPLILSSEKGLYNEEIGYGLSIQPPISFKRATSYNGFQAPNKLGSISLNVAENFDFIKEHYSIDAIEDRDGSIYRHQAVQYGSDKTGLYVEYYDNPQKRYRQELFIVSGEKVYHIKGFHRLRPNAQESNEIRRAIQTAHIDPRVDISEFRKVEKPFSKIFLADLENVHYTRDNKYPTEEPDSMLVKVGNITQADYNKYDIIGYLKEEVTKITKTKVKTSTKRLSNGMLYKCTSKSEDKSALFVIMTSDESADATLIKCIGNEKADLKKTSIHILSEFMAIVD